jgi:hypothetical protein
LFYFENLLILGNSAIFGTGFSLKSKALLKSFIPLYTLNYLQESKLEKLASWSTTEFKAL